MDQPKANLEELAAKHKAQADRNRARLSRAFQRVLKMPKHLGAVSPYSLLEVQIDVQRIVKHAEKLGWVKIRSVVEIEEEKA